MLLGNALDVIHLGHDLAGQIDDLLACRGDFGELLACAHEYLHAELVFDLADLLADPGLRGVQAFGGR